jgi:hypothetical protein
VLRTLLNQPPGDRQSESAEPTRDEVASVGTERYRLFRLGDDPYLVLAEGHDDLADVFGLRHMPEGVSGLGDRERFEGQRLKLIRLEVPHGLAQKKPAQVGPLLHHLREVYGEERDVLSEQPEIQPSVP